MGSVSILVPGGFKPDGPLRDRLFARFIRKDDSPELFEFNLSYWVADDVPTEDRANLLGAYADHDLLHVQTGRVAGRIVVDFENGRTSQQTGLDVPGHRLIGLLSNPLDWVEWRTLEQTAHFPAECICKSTFLKNRI